MSTPAPAIPLAILREAHSLLMAAITASPCLPGPLLHAAVEVADGLEALEDEALQSAADVLRDLWPPHRSRDALQRAVQAGAITHSEIAAWMATQTGGSGLEAESALDALLDAVGVGEVALAEAEAALEDEQGRIVGGERG